MSQDPAPPTASSSSSSIPSTAAVESTSSATAIGSFFSSVSDTYTHFSTDPSLQRFLERALQLLGPPGTSRTVLDCGSGTGQPVAAALAGAGHRVTGLDLSSEMVAAARRNVPAAAFEEADMRVWAPPPGVAYDAIFGILSLFALSREDIEGVVRKWAGELAPGGSLSVCVLPAEIYWGRETEEGRGGSWDADGKCVRDLGFRFMNQRVTITLLTRERWRELMREAGLEIVDEMEGLFVPPPEAGSEEELHFYLVGRRK